MIDFLKSVVVLASILFVLSAALWMVFRINPDMEHVRRGAFRWTLMSGLSSLISAGLYQYFSL